MKNVFQLKGSLTGANGRFFTCASPKVTKTTQITDLQAFVFIILVPAGSQNPPSRRRGIFVFTCAS